MSLKNNYLSEEVLLTLGWTKENVDLAIVTQDILFDNETVFVTNINTENANVNKWLENNQPDFRKVLDFDIESYTVWIEGCEFPIILDDCDLVTTDLEDTQLEKAIALLKNHNLDANSLEDIEISEYNVSDFTINGAEYKILDEDEREEEVTDYIKMTLWAFNPSFLAEETDWDLLQVYEAFIKADLCEGANDAILCLVEKFTTVEDFVNSAVSADGYGHFLSHYDGDELEQDNFYIYRIN